MDLNQVNKLRRLHNLTRNMYYTRYDPAICELGRRVCVFVSIWGSNSAKRSKVTAAGPQTAVKTPSTARGFIICAAQQVDVCICLVDCYSLFFYSPKAHFGSGIGVVGDRVYSIGVN